MNKFKQIKELCEIRGYVKSFNLKDKDKLKLGPAGCLLEENLRTEWLHSSVIKRDISVFFSTTKFLTEIYDFVKETCQNRVPFGIAQITDEYLEEQQIETTEWNDYFHPRSQIKLESFLFVSPNNSAQYFYNWQKLRRMWWRMLSTMPGRYELSDIQTCSSNRQTVDITSKFPWGQHVIENIVLIPNAETLLPGTIFEVKDNRKKVQAHCIKSTTHLSTMVMNMLCDAYDEPLYHGNKRPLLRFHRKIAPYKISFAISATNASKTDELNDLALYLCKKLRENNVSVLLLPIASRNSLESQWQIYDQVGIPYCIILNDSTLVNGIAYLRSRDTTLKEQVHVRDLSAYVQQLFKNY